MKHLKIWSKLAFVMMLLSLTTACGSDDEETPKTGSELVSQAAGTWMCTQSTDSQYGYTAEGLMVGKEVTIKKDGTFTSTAPSFGYSGTYTVEGNTITAKSSSGTFVVNVTVNGLNMEWSGTASNGVTFHYVFKKES